MTITKTVKFDTDSIKSIEQAEKKKARLENQGYKLFTVIVGRFSLLIYKKEQYKMLTS